MPERISLSPRTADSIKRELGPTDAPLAFFRLHVEPTKRYVRLFIDGSVQPVKYVEDEVKDDGFLETLRRVIGTSQERLKCHIFLTDFLLHFDLNDLDFPEFKDLKTVDPIHRARYAELQLEKSLANVETDKDPEAGLETGISFGGVTLKGTAKAPGQERSRENTAKRVGSPTEVKFYGNPIPDVDAVSWRFEAPVRNLKHDLDTRALFGPLVEGMNIAFGMAPMARLSVVGSKPGFQAVMRVHRLGYAFDKDHDARPAEHRRAQQVVGRIATAMAEEGFLTFAWEGSHVAQDA